MSVMDSIAERYEAQIAALEAERGAAIKQLAVEVGAFKALLLEWMPVMRAHTGASHLTDGFRPTPNKWDDLMMRTQEALDK